MEHTTLTGGDLTFSEALIILKTGNMVKRKGWSGSKFVQIQQPDGNSKMNRPYIYMTIQGEAGEEPTVIPWLSSQADLLTDDWMTL